MKSLRIYLLLAVATYAAACAYFYFAQDRLIFAGAPAVAATDAAVAISLEVPDATLAGYLVNPEGDVDVVYFGGNAEAVAVHARRFARVRNARTLLMDYRGYGRSAGIPSGSLLVADALRYVPELTRGQQRPLVFVGRSLGSGVAALTAAALGGVDALVLISPYCSFANVVARNAPAWLPSRALLKHPFDVAAVVDKLPQRLIVVIAANDQVILPSESYCLIEKAWSKTTTVVEIPLAGHNDVFDGHVLWDAIAAEIDRLR